MNVKFPNMEISQTYRGELVDFLFIPYLIISLITDISLSLSLSLSLCVCVCVCVCVCLCVCAV
jgi:hypothetical protein